MCVCVCVCVCVFGYGEVCLDRDRCVWIRGGVLFWIRGACLDKGRCMFG